MTESILYEEMHRFAKRHNLAYSEMLLIKDFCWMMEIKYGHFLNENENAQKRLRDGK